MCGASDRCPRQRKRTIGIIDRPRRRLLDRARHGSGDPRPGRSRGQPGDRASSVSGTECGAPRSIEPIVADAASNREDRPPKSRKFTMPVQCNLGSCAEGQRDMCRSFPAPQGRRAARTNWCRPRQLRAAQFLERGMPFWTSAPSRTIAANAWPHAARPRRAGRARCRRPRHWCRGRPRSAG